METEPGFRSRVVGCLFGGALGDAWGGPFEGNKGPLEFEIPPFPTLSDDTELTLATCRSLLRCGDISPEDIACEFVREFKVGGIHGMGSSTLKAMRDLSVGVHWALAGARGEFAAGNGAAMRIAPLAFVLNSTASEDRVLIRDVCRITHHSDEAYSAALAVVIAIRSVLTGTWSREYSFLHCVADQLPDSAVRDRVHEILELDLCPSEIGARFGATGHAVDSIPLALHCAQHITTNTLPATLAAAITIGGDTDTIASIVGHLAGTVVGSAAVPNEHLRCIRGADNLFSITNEFADFVSNRRSS